MAYGTVKADGFQDSSGATFDLTAATTSEATTSAKGYMSSADKTKLDGIDIGTVDVSTAAPTDGQVLIYSSASSKWLPGTAGGGGAFAETGTWTPKMMKNYTNSGTPADADFYTHTYMQQTGIYARVGKLVTISYYLQNPGTITTNTTSPILAYPHHVPKLGNLPYPIADDWWGGGAVHYFGYLSELDGYTYGPNTYGPWTNLNFMRANGTAQHGQGFYMIGHEVEQQSIYEIPSERGFGVAYGVIKGSIQYITDDTTETPFNSATAD